MNDSPTDFADITMISHNSRTVQEAEAIALNAFCAFNDTNVVCSRSLSLSTEAITRHRSRSTSADTLLLIVNYGNSNGFAVIGGPKNSEPLYAFIESGNFNDPEVQQVDGFQMFMESALDHISILPLNPIDTLERDSSTLVGEFKYENEWKLSRIGGHTLNLNWGQGETDHSGRYEGMYCPNKIAGCVMTASLLTMAYLEKPQTFYFSFPERDCVATTVNWSILKSHVKSHYRDYNQYDEYGNRVEFTIFCRASEQDLRDLGRITRQIGYEINATYSDKSTGAVTLDAVNLLKTKYLSNCSYKLIEWSNSNAIKTNLLNSLETGVALTRGDDGISGHAWIADGYKVMDLYRNLYQKKT